MPMALSSKESKLEIFCSPMDRIVRARPGESVLEALIRSDVGISHSCGGNGTCGTCRIIVNEGLEKLHPRTELETEIAADRNFHQSERLGCQTRPTYNLKISVPTESENS
jgi:2Fe-2S ferredoxin